MTDSTIMHIATVFPVDPEALKPEPTLHRRLSIIREYSLNTSTHGIPGIARSQSIHNRVFWSVMSLIFAGIMFYFIIESILAYFAYPTQTSVAVVVEWPQAFPAVTICNYSPLRYDRFIGPFLNYTNIRNVTNTNDTTTFTASQASYIRDFLQYKLNRDESLNDCLFPLSSMLMNCTYNGLSCSVNDFTPFITPLYGLCYTFNAQLKNASSTVRYNADNGSMGLLELRLYAQSHQYVPYLSNGVGMMAMVHDNTQMPNVDMGGMELGPGRLHRLSYTKQATYALSSPYSTCSDNVNFGLQSMYDQFEDVEYTYSEINCYIVCIQAYTYKKCGCVSPLRWSFRSVALPGSNTIIHAPLCNWTDPCYSAAATELMTLPEVYLSFCSGCPHACTVVDFSIKSSSLSAPPSFLLNDIKQFVESSSIPLPANWSSTWRSEIQANYVALEVVCENTRLTNYTQQATLGPVDVLSNVGGQTGLWIGISFLSLMEIAEMLYRLIRYQVYQIREKVRKRTQNQAT